MQLYTAEQIKKMWHDEPREMCTGVLENNDIIKLYNDQHYEIFKTNKIIEKVFLTPDEFRDLLNQFEEIYNENSSSIEHS